MVIECYIIIIIIIIIVITIIIIIIIIKTDHENNKIQTKYLILKMKKNLACNMYTCLLWLMVFKILLVSRTERNQLSCLLI